MKTSCDLDLKSMEMMMTMRKRTIITTETRELLIFRDENVEVGECSESADSKEELLPAQCEDESTTLQLEEDQ